MSDEYRAATRNAVIVKDDVGRGRPTIYDLPAEGHAYGRSEPPDAEGAREVIGSWASHVPHSKPGLACQDFRKLNRKAATDGVANARALKDWRTGNDIKLVPKGPAGAVPKVIPSDVIPSFAYGKKSRPSTPIHSVVGGQYATEQEEALRQMYQRHADEKDMPNGKRVIKLTVASKNQISNARSARSLSQDQSDPQAAWKMAKFANVKGRCNFAELARAASVPALRA